MKKNFSGVERDTNMFKNCPGIAILNPYQEHNINMNFQVNGALESPTKV
jgi:hypothetical protein